MLYMCFFKKIKFSEDDDEPITNPILKIKKEKEEKDSPCVVTSYKTNPLFQNSAYSVKTYNSNEKTNEDGWKSFPDDIEVNLASIYKKDGDSD